MNAEKVKLGFLASGRGSNMLSIIDACSTGSLDAEPAVVISNNANAGALAIASQKGIPGFHLSSKTHVDSAQLDQVITDTLKQTEAEYVILAGYMKKVGTYLLHEFSGRIINIHPSLLPKYGGKGMYGIHVHESVLAAGDTETGVTIHLVDSEYDQGEVLAQKTVPVEPGDTPEILAARVLKLEHQLYPETLQKMIEGKIRSK